MIDTAKDIIQYIKNPECGFRENLSLKQKLQLVLHTLFISLITCLSLVSVFSVLEHFELIDMSKHASADLFKKYPKIVIFLLVTVLAPLLEELIFRAPITLFCKYRKQFKYIFYAFAILFGYVHITNFEMTIQVLLLSPILVLPQVILGLILGFVRIKIGLIYAILLHAVYNGLLTLPMLIFSDILDI